MTGTRNRPLEIMQIIHLESLECLVDELIKDKPHEQKVRRFMEAAGLSYSSDPIVRMNLVLATMDKIQESARRTSKRRGRENDKST